MSPEIKAWSESLGKLSARLRSDHDGEESARIITDLGAVIRRGEVLARRRPDSRELAEAVLAAKTAYACLETAHRRRLN